MEDKCCLGDVKKNTDKNTDKKAFVLLVFGCRIFCQSVAVALLCIIHIVEEDRGLFHYSSNEEFIH